jgi:hypothetical protein
MDPWPAELQPVFSSLQVCEYASLTRDGRPVTWAVTPYLGNGTLDISTGLSYPDKAERARRNRRVALLFSEPSGSGLTSPPVVLVQGSASVRDADLQANTDRYVRESLPRNAALSRMPGRLLRGMGWYLARIWVEVTPERITWWPGGDLGQPPRVWHDPAASAPPSDPAPRGPRLPSRNRPPQDWSANAQRADRLGPPVLTWVDEGRPFVARCRAGVRTASGFRVTPPVGVTVVPGPVCLTFHQVGPATSWQENVVLLGDAAVAGDDVDIRVERALTDWSINGNPAQRLWRFMGQSRELRRRAATEAERRGQPVPTIHPPR